MTNYFSKRNAINRANTLLIILETPLSPGTSFASFEAIKRRRQIDILKSTLNKFSIKPEETDNPALCRKYIDGSI